MRTLLGQKRRAIRGTAVISFETENQETSNSSPMVTK
jgi:hypothetical protein